jgi:hypothetical protein
MKLLSLASITVILIIIIGGYLVFTQEMNGRATFIIIIFLIVLAIMLLTSLDIFKKYYQLVDNSTSANSGLITIGGEKLPDIKSSFSISTWIYISDWNYNFGKNKNILSYFQDSSNNPLTFNLDSFENNLIINYNTFSDSTTLNNVNSTQTQIIIPNINIQKWVNIICCFNGNQTDTYINGKLIDSTINITPLYVPISQGDIILVNNGGYSGQISNTRYYNYFLSPSQVWEIYKQGYSSNLLGSLINRYKATFTFYQDNNPVYTYTT